MTEIINLFKKLSDYFDTSVTGWENVEECYRSILEDKTCPASSTTKTGNNAIVSSIVVRRANENSDVLPTLLELCTTIRSLRGESSSSYDNTYDCWDKVIAVAPRNFYLHFLYTLSGLALLDVTSTYYTKLALAAVNTYFLSLTIPGAKSFHIFEESVIEHCLEVFTLVEQIQNPEVLKKMSRQQPVEIWVRLVALCDDLKLLLRYVHFNDHRETLFKLMKKLLDIQYINHDKGYANHYAAILHAKCFEIFEEMINSHNGEPKDTLMKLMNMTVFLHTYPPKPKNTSGIAIGSTECDHISDWFINCISKYPGLLVDVLTFYIKCIITNPMKSWKTEQTQRALEYGAKYDAALFIKCNESCVELLCDTIYADDVMIRTRTVELIVQVLQLESRVNWQVFRHKVAIIPREVHLIKELIDSLRDNNNTVKLRAVQALNTVLIKGSPNAKTIMTEGLQFAQFNDNNVTLPIEPRLQKNEIRYEKPKPPVPNYSFDGYELIELSFLHLPEYLYANLFQSPVSILRRAGITFMEQVIKINPLAIFNTNFVEETVNFVNEPVALVRKQTLQTIDSLLGCYPNCYPVIWVWCRIISPMMQDGDPKNIDIAMECFRSRVLLNIKGIDKTNQAEHFMPWVIIRTMLSTQSRLYLQTCFHRALQQRLITTQMLSMIESHLLTSNSTEAWSVLNFVSGKIKSKEPDSLIHLFISLDSWNREQNMLIALEVLANCIEDFSHTALNHAFNHIVTNIREGKIMPVVIGKAFDFLLLIDNRSNAQDANSSKRYSTVRSASSEKDWITNIHRFLEYKILEGISDFPENRSIFMSYLYSYSELNLQTRLRPHNTIISFIHKYMQECIKMQEADLDLENERLFNSMILIAGRVSIRDACVARTTCTLYSRILRKIDRPSIVNTIIVSITDLCKKHTNIVEAIIGDVMQKLSSPYELNRIETFKCFEKLVLQDQLKLRGTLLLLLLAASIDDSEKLATRACAFFTEYLASKNRNLFQRCLIECPFVFNDYENFDDLDSFSDTTISSPLKGESKIKHRWLLYNHLMAKIDDVNLILYFAQLKLITEKSQYDPMMSSSVGIALINDVLFILKRICHIVKPDKPNAEEPDEAAAEIDQILENDTAAKNAPDAIAGEKATAKKGGRGRRGRDVVTMKSALESLEIALPFMPTLYDNTQNYHESIKKSFDELCKALWIRFPEIVEASQPAKFWNKYRPNETVFNSKTKTKRKKKSNNKTRSQPETEEIQNAENEMSEENSQDRTNYSSEDELPLVTLHSVYTPTKRARYSNAELPMEYIFNPNI